MFNTSISTKLYNCKTPSKSSRQFLKRTNFKRTKLRIRLSWMLIKRSKCLETSQRDSVKIIISIQLCLYSGCVAASHEIKECDCSERDQRILPDRSNLILIWHIPNSLYQIVQTLCVFNQIQRTNYFSTVHEIVRLLKCL